MRYYILAFDKDDQHILGNLDGQAALGERKAPWLCREWQRLHNHKDRPNYERVAYWELVNDRGYTLKTRVNERALKL